MPPSPPSPPYTSRKLAKLVGVEHRTLLRWIAADLLSPTPFHGPKTSYGARHLEEARAIVRLRVDNLTYAAIARRLRGLSDEDLARLSQHGERPAALAPPPTAPEPPPVSPTGPAAPPGPPASPERNADPATERPSEAPEPGPSDPWERVVLLPGLELFVRLGAGPLVQRLAAEIQAHYGVRGAASGWPDGPR